jgi:hypothetical protein
MTRNTLFSGLGSCYSVYCYCSLLRCLCCVGWISLLHEVDIFVAWDGYIIVVCILRGTAIVMLQDRAVYML